MQTMFLHIGKVGDQRVMTSKPVVLQFQITELPTLVEQKSKQRGVNEKPELMFLPINDLSYLDIGRPPGRQN